MFRPANWAMARNTARLDAALERQGVRQLGAGRQLEPWRRGGRAPLDQQLAARSCRRAISTACRRGVSGARRAARRRPARRSDSAPTASWYSTSASSYRSAAAKRRRAHGVFLRGAELGALERQAAFEIVGIRAERVVVFDDGAIVVLGLLRPVRPRESTAASSRRPQREHRREARRPARVSSARAQRLTGPALVTSAPRGIENSNALSARPGFSLKFVNVNVDRAALLLGDGEARMRSVLRSAVSSSQS